MCIHVAHMSARVQESEDVRRRAGGEGRGSEERGRWDQVLGLRVLEAFSMELVGDALNSCPSAEPESAGNMHLIWLHNCSSSSPTTLTGKNNMKGGEMCWTAFNAQALVPQKEICICITHVCYFRMTFTTLQK